MTDHFRVAVHCVGKKGVKDPFRASCSLWREERSEGLPPELAVHCGGKKGVKNTFRGVSVSFDIRDKAKFPTIVVDWSLPSECLSTVYPVPKAGEFASTDQRANGV